MKKILIITLLLIPAIILGQQGVVIKNINFSSIDIKDKIKVQLIKSDESYIEVITKNNKPQYIEYEIDNDTLILKKKKDADANEEIFVNVYYKNVYKIKATKKAEISSKNIIKTDNLIVELSWGAQALLDLDIKDFKVKLIEGSLCSVNGYADNISAYLTTGSTFSAFTLEAKKCDIIANANSKAKIYVTEELKAEAASLGNILYKGNPMRKDVKVKVGGKIENLKE